MSSSSLNSERIIIVGGGFAGLSAAVRLSQAGLPVTLLEASKLGFAASSRNQGWLHSGAQFAKSSPELARLCYESLQQTVAYSPDCIEPDVSTMIYGALSADTDRQAWLDAWKAVGIPYDEIPKGELNWCLPEVNCEKLAWAYRLPDRSFRPDVLLSQLAKTALDSGVEIRPNAFVSNLILDGQEARGVRVGENEEIRGGLVILATGALSTQGFSPLYHKSPGEQSDYRLVNLKTHLRALQPGMSSAPFCLVDGIGLNHLPHRESSVFGLAHWQVVSSADDNAVDTAEIQKIEDQLQDLFTQGYTAETDVKDWAGTTVQAMHAEQIEPGVAPLPTVIDHAEQPCGIKNVLSIFPGRATLWAHLADTVTKLVLESTESKTLETAAPPWAFH